MPEYLAPGVYVEEVTGGIKPIEGVATSTAGFAGGTERGPTTPPQLVTSWSDYLRRFGGFIDDSLMPFAVKGFFDNGGKRCYIARVAGGGDEASRVLSGGQGGIRLEALGPGVWGRRLFVRIDPPTRPRQVMELGVGQDDPNQFRLTLLYFDVDPGDPFVDPLEPENDQHPNRREPTVVEQFDNLGIDPLRGGFVEKVVNTQSNLVRVSPHEDGWDRPDDTTDFMRFEHGSDGTIDATAIVGTSNGSPDQHTGLAALELVDQIAILCVPDEVRDDVDGDGRALIRDALVNQCNRTKDRFAILQLPRSYVDANTEDGTLQELPDTTRAAVYHPWVRVFDPRTKSTVLVPPGGFVAGVFARTDIERGVHKAPANEVVRGIILADLNSDRPLSVIYNKRQQDVLNPRGINIIRDFRSDRRGIRVWGARTLSSDPEWKYVNVRRLFLFVEESIDEGTQWVVFEPNHEPTWAKVRRSITNFLTSVWRSGALMGVTQEEAFFVKCDRTTMIQDDIDNGRLICYIGIAPVKPAEFVIFRISQKTLEATG